MLKSVKMGFALVLAVVLAVELETEGEGKGAEKKAEATTRIEQAVDPLLPDWLNPVVRVLSGMLIDCLVLVSNRTGFFAEFASISKSLPATP